MKKQLLEAGKIVNTHGINGTVKIQPWCDTPDFLCGFKKVYINDVPYRVISSSVQGTCVLARLSGVNNMEQAQALRDCVVFIDRDDCDLEDGTYFIQDLIGLKVIDSDSGASLGTLADILELPGNNVYVVKGDREILIPAVDEFIISTDIDAGVIKVRLIEGM